MKKILLFLLLPAVLNAQNNATAFDIYMQGKGVGKLLMGQCFTVAKDLGYKKIYLETMPELNIAVPLYEKMGFTYLDAPQGNSGHCGCDIWMIKDLDH